MNVQEAISLMTSRTNVGQRQMMKCRETLELTEEMWLDEMSMMTTMSFAKLVERHCMQFDNWKGASSQAHTEVGTMKFKQSLEGLCHHEFSPEFIEALKNRETQMVAAVKKMQQDSPNNNKNEQEKHKNCVTSWEHQQ